MVMARSASASADSSNSPAAHRTNDAGRIDAAAPGLPSDSEAGRDTSEDDDSDLTLDSLLLDPHSHSHSTDSQNNPTIPWSLTPSGNLELEAAKRLDRRHDDSIDGLAVRVASGPMDRKKMDEEAIAGTVVGVILGVALLACCLYPVIVRRLKKHRRARRFFDCEGETYRGEPGISLRRLSNESIKPTEGTRGIAIGDEQRPSHDTYGSPPAGPQAPSRQPSTPGYVDASLDQNIAIEPAVSRDLNYYANPFPLGEGQAYPADQNGSWQYVLKGTSEDYYSPYVPSEAFGMYPNPDADEGIPKPRRAVSRGTSLRYNVKQLLRRKTLQEHSSNSHAPNETSDEGAGRAGPQHAESSQQFFTHHETTESPTEVDSSQLPFSSRGRGVPGAGPRGSTRSQTDPGASQAHYYDSICPPSQAFPGTVNPMDIMPASTASEVYHRTDYQLYTGSSYESPTKESTTAGDVAMSDTPTTAQPETPQIQPPPPPQQAPPLDKPTEQPTEPTQTDAAPVQQEPPKRTASASLGDSLPTRTAPISLPNQRSASFNPSERSTPAQGTTSTTTQSTPSTHADSPSPESVNSSDYANSASPHALGIPSPRGGVYCCDEPGCSQVFDQPHKLKHHQRYHSKDHKCPYPACGKGFGTKTHLQRHINDRHEKKKKFHCSIQGCDYSRAGGKAFPRKDNWKRHMTKIHGMDHRRLPEPVEVDQEMT